LGDAVFIAIMRLEYGATGVNPLTCVSGDFDSDGSFTLNDAAYVAEAQFNKALLPWDKRRRLALAQPSTPQPHLSLAATPTASKRQMSVHVQQSSTSDVEWKALGVQFVGGTIESVKMHHGLPGQITAQHRAGVFQAAELGGKGLTWPNGLAATVTFAEDTDMSAVRIDYASANTYVVQVTDVACSRAQGARCAEAVYFREVAPIPDTKVNLSVADVKGHSVWHDVSDVIDTPQGVAALAVSLATFGIVILLLASVRRMRQVVVRMPAGGDAKMVEP
jgi:hypothetical protein